MLTLDLEPGLERRIFACAQLRGVSGPELIRALFDEALEDLEDIEIAVERLANPMKSLTSAEARKAPGLDD